MLWLAACSPTLTTWRADEVSVLVFSRTEGYRHAAIADGREALAQLGEDHGFGVVLSEDSALFTDASLAQFAVIVFLNTTGDILSSEEQAAFERYIRGGGGFVGIHAAADTEYDWAWFGQLVGARFRNHPAVQEAMLSVIERGHPATAGLPEHWTKRDEWYNFDAIQPGIEVLIEIDEGSYEGGENGPGHPIAWHHTFDGGRAFYTAMGHTRETYSDPLFLSHLLGGLSWAAGEGVLAGALPDQSFFVREVLAENLNEPMALAELPGEGILFVERRGALKLHRFDTGETGLVADMAVYDGDEDGLLGVAVDPDYGSNHWIYLFYSAPEGPPRQHVSRFSLIDGVLERSSEQVLLQIPTDHSCCHSGGALEFGPDGNLYIGVGDNTNPFESDGFAPIDERPGRAAWDAQRSAANSMDLRGKILRIRPEPDGGYSIPPGNLFPPGTPDARPEIYIMGCRNPFRFGFDSASGALYWGDIGPDAGKADPTRGPEGMGEFNRAQGPGFWGWPYTRGDNQVYRDYDFASGESGEVFDAAAPVNDSANNTGLRQLPPAQASLVWYSYAPSQRFPWLGDGGVNPMAGPVFRRADFDGGVTTFPAYFEGSLLLYEWMRDWIYVVRLDGDGRRLLSAEPFMPGHEFSRPMDMLFAADGQLYLLEYGQKWFSRNPDARLNAIRFDPAAGGGAVVPLPARPAEEGAGLPEGERLVEASGCGACHALDAAVNGPSYMQLARRYSHDDLDYLVAKVANGGAGAWGERAMPAHPQLSVAQLRSMLTWILAQDVGHRP